MKVLAVLQNQWFKDPDRVRAILERNPHLRRPFCARALFAGCQTGRVLRRILGKEWCARIIWENASPQIGGVSSAAFPADLKYLQAVIDEVKPDIILAFGRIATNALQQLVPPRMLLVAPHPTARRYDLTVPKIEAMRAYLDQRAKEEDQDARAR